MKNKFRFYDKIWLCVLTSLCKALASAFLAYYTAKVLALLVDNTLAAGAAYTFRENTGKLAILLAVIGLHYILNYWKDTLFEWESYFARNKVLGAILEIPYDTIYQKNQAEYFHMISSDLELASSFFGELDSTINQFAKSFGAILFIFSLSWQIGLALALLGLAIVFYHHFISPRFGSLQGNIQADGSDVRNIAMQTYASYEYGHFFPFALLEQKFDAAYTSFISHSLEKAKWQAITSIFDYLLGFLQTYLPLLLVGIMAGEFSLGNVLAILGNTVAFMGVFRAIGRMLIGIQKSLAGITRILPLMETAEKKKGMPLHKDSLRQKRISRIEIKDLTYQYEDGRTGISIKNASLDASANIGITGVKGSGKTTLLKILTGLLENYQGRVTLDGAEIRNLDLSINSYMAYLPQDFPIFDMTILENFELMAPGKSPQEYLQYAALVNMEREIKEMPEGLNTSVNSNKVSTGQRQRLSLCMVLMRESPLIVLDEPASNLDPENTALLRRLFGSMTGKLFLIVSHDPEIFDDTFRIHMISLLSA